MQEVIWNRYCKKKLGGRGGGITDRSFGKESKVRSEEEAVEKTSNASD
jgi:hypothetical protein